MTTVLCTLYNSFYLDKGLVLYDSLIKCANDFKLYVLCMDDKCYDILIDLNLPKQIPVRLCDFEVGDDELLSAKANRTMGEYCWTCSSSFIRYVLKHYNEPLCTYIDADMYFYNDPQVLVEEMLSVGKSVMVVPHRFTERNQHLAKTIGTYCVEFNTFLNKPESLGVLEYWRNRCLDCCSNLADGIHWGDQKYLEELVDKFACVHVCENPGAGIAPWNIEWYENGVKEMTVTYRKDQTLIPVVFYHFQAISYNSRKSIDTSLQKNNKYIDYLLANIFYVSYLHKLDKMKDFIKGKYGIDFINKGHPSKKPNVIKSFLKSFGFVRMVYNKITHNDPYIIEIDE